MRGAGPAPAPPPLTRAAADRKLDEDMANLGLGGKSGVSFEEFKKVYGAAMDLKMGHVGTRGMKKRKKGDEIGARASRSPRSPTLRASHGPGRRAAKKNAEFSAECGYDDGSYLLLIACNKYEFLSDLRFAVDDALLIKVRALLRSCAAPRSPGSPPPRDVRIRW